MNGFSDASLLRPEVLGFAFTMEKRLRENDYKGGWQDETFGYLFDRLQEEVIELGCALKEANQDDDVFREAADVANFAMMLAHNWSRRLEMAMRRSRGGVHGKISQAPSHS